MRDLQRRDLDVLLTKVQREAYVSKARRAKRKARSLEKKTPETLESITTPEADARLSKLVEGNPRFIGYSAAELAKIITRNARKNCSATTVKNTRCWKEIMEERRRQKGDSRSLAAVNLSHTLAAATPDKRQGTPLEELARTEEQQSAIRQVEQSAMNSEVKEMMVEQLRDGDLRPEDLPELIELAIAQNRDYEPPPTHEGRKKVRQHKRL